MKDMQLYIDEKILENLLTEGKLKEWLGKFFKRSKNKQDKSLTDDEKKTGVKFDAHKIKATKDTLKLTEINGSTLESINDKEVGFPITSVLIKNSKKYLSDEDTEYSGDTIMYVAKDAHNNDSVVGLVSFDEKVEYITGYKYIINIEIANNVANKQEIAKAVFNCYLNEKIKKDKDINGVCSKPILPQLKGNLLKLGFKASNADKKILIYNI